MKDTRYRFHGSQKPIRRSVFSALTATEDGNGTASLRLYDPIDSWGGEWGVSAKEFAAALDAVKSAEEIRLHINSPGGEVFEGITIANQLRQNPAKVVAVVDGLAASAASFIACAADETVMAPNSQLMIHDAWGLCVGNAKDMRDHADLLDHLSANVADMYAQKAGGSVDTWRAAMLAETWYSAQEAVDAGLADSVLGADAATEGAAFDLSVFRFQGRDNAPDPTVKPEPATPDPQASGRPEWQARRHRMNERKLTAA